MCPMFYFLAASEVHPHAVNGPLYSGNGGTLFERVFNDHPLCVKTSPANKTHRPQSIFGCKHT